VQNGSGQGWRALLDARWLVFAVVATVAVFSFIVSYSHIYDLGRAHAQSGTAARLLPLTVDLLIVAASLVLFIQAGTELERASLAFWMPRLVLYAAIGATVAANVAYGLPSGWLSAVISGWPGAAFVAAVEVGILVAGPVKRGRDSSAAASALPDAVPATRPATLAAFIPPYAEMQQRQGCGPKTAKKMRAEMLRLVRRIEAELGSPAGSPTPAAGEGGRDTGEPTPRVPAALNGHAHG